jgi:carbamate kinase
LAELARDHDLVVTHGNGPQVGLLALQAAADRNGTPLDVLGAESDGMIGYVLAQELGNAMAVRDGHRADAGRRRASDPAFDHPTKPIGPTYADRARAPCSSAAPAP